MQGPDAVAGDHFQVRGDQYAALAEDGLARLEADGRIAGDGTDHADVTGGFGDDLLAGSDGDVAQAQAAGGVQVQAGVDDAAVVDVQAVGRDAQRLVGRAVDHLVLVVGSHGLLAHLQGGIAGGVGLEHGQIGGGLGGGGGVTDRRGGRQVGGGGVDRSVGDVQGVVQLDQQVLLRCQAVALVAVQCQGGGGHHQVDHGEGGVGTGVTGERYGLGGTGDDRCSVTHHGGGVQRSVQRVGGGRHAVDLVRLRRSGDVGQALGQLGQAVLHGGRGHQGLVVLQLLDQDVQLQQLGGGLGIARRVFGDGGVAGQLGGVLARGVGGQADVVAADVLRGAVAVDDHACGRSDGDVTGAAGIEHADGDVRLRLQGDVAAIGLQVAGDDHTVVARHRRAGLGHRGQGDAAATWQVDGVVLVEEDDVARGRGQGQGAAIHGDGAAAVVQHGDRGRDDGDCSGALAGQRAAVDRYGAGVGSRHATATACCGEEADVQVQVALLADAARGAHVQLAGDHVGLGLVGAAIFDGAAGAQLDVVAACVDVTQLDAAISGDLNVAAGAAAGGLHQGQQVAVALAGVDTAVGGVDHQFVDLDFQGVAAGTEGLHGSGQAAGDEVGSRAVAVGDVAGHLEVDGAAGLDLAHDHVTGVLEGDLAVGGQDVQQADGADVGVIDVASGGGQVDRASHLAGQCLGAGTDGTGVDGQGTGRDRRAHGVGGGGHGATGGQGDGGLGYDRVDGQVAALADGDGTVGGAGLGGQGQVAGGVGDIGEAVAAGQVQAAGLGLQRGVGGADVAGGVDDHVFTDDGAAALGDVAGGGQRDALVGAGVDAVDLEAAGGVGERQVQGLDAVEGQGVEVAAVDQRATGEGDVGVAVRGGHRQAAQCLGVGHVHAGLGRGGGGGDGVDAGGQRFVGGAGGRFARRGQAACGDVGARTGGGDATIAGSQGDVAAGGGDAANGDAALGGVEHNVVVGTGGGQGADGQAVAFAQVHAAVAGAGVDGVALGAQGQGFVTDFLACAQVDGATDQRGAGLGGQDAAGVGGDVQAVGG